MHKRKLLVLGIGLLIGMAVLWLNDSSASAVPACFNDQGRRNNAKGVSNTYPRAGTSVVSNFFCGVTSSSDQWVLLSSYYHNGVGAPGSTLHTPNAQFRVFTSGPPTAAVTVRIERSATGRCNYTSASDVQLARRQGGNPPVFITQLDDKYYYDYTIPANQFAQGQSKYGQTVWEWDSTFYLTALSTTSIHCRVRITSFSANSYLTLIEDPTPQSSHSEANNKYNQNNAGTGAGAKTTLGPINGLGGAVALYADLPSGVLEYSIPIQLDCNAPAGRYYLRYYDPDAPVAGNPAGTSQPAGFPGLAIYRDSDGALIYDNPTVTEGNDVYGQILMPAMAQGVKYSMVWYNITARNGLQFWMPFSEATSIPGNSCGGGGGGPHMTCSFGAINPVSQGSAVTVTVTINNVSSVNWPGGASLEMGIVDPANSYATVNGLPTQFNWANPGVGVGPPDHNSYTYVNNANGSGTSWHAESYNLAGPVPPQIANATVDRFFLNPGISAGGSVTYTFSVLTPNSPSTSKNYGVRLIDRAAVLGLPGYSWMNWSPSCEFTVRTLPADSVAVVCSTFDLISVDPEPGEPILFTTSAQNNTAPGNAPLTGYNMNVTLPSGGSSNYAYTPASVPPGARAISNTITIAAGLTAGNHTVNWSFSNGATSTGNCSGTIVVRAKPYVRFYGNDVSSGGGFGSGCTATSADNKTLAFGRYGNASAVSPSFGEYRGSASELAVFAAGQITGVLPGSQRDRGTRFNELSFANNALTNNDQQFDFNGGYGESICAFDYYSSRPTGAPQGQSSSVTLNTLPSNTYFFTPSGGRSYVEFTTTGRINNRLVVYVDGDVIMGGSIPADTTIAYNDGPWANVNAIPSLYVIASGNIYIDNDVQRLDGTYIAQTRTDGSKGEIYSCSMYTGGPNLIKPVENISNVSGNCGYKLTVNGAFIAKRVYLNRILGTIRAGSPYEGSGSGNIAEVFNFSPETYLVNGGGLPPVTTGQSIDSIISLPPSF